MSDFERSTEARRDHLPRHAGLIGVRVAGLGRERATLHRVLSLRETLVSADADRGFLAA